VAAATVLGLVVAAAQARLGLESSGLALGAGPVSILRARVHRLHRGERPRESLVGLSTLAVGLLAYWLQKRK